MTYTLEHFLSLFDFKHDTTFEDFSCQVSVLNGSDRSGNFVVRSDLDTFIKRVAKKDDREARLDLYKRKLYKMLVEEPEVALTEWFNKTADLKEPLDFYFDIPDADILVDNTFAGRTNSKYGRVCKNINFNSFFNTKKLYSNDFEYTFGLLKTMFEDFKIRNSLAAPAFFDHICKIDGNYNQVWVDFMIGCNRASIFNPATYRGIVDELFEGETLFAPCMGWNAYQIGFYSSKFTHLIATDVIPEVVENGRLLHEEWKKYSDRGIWEMDTKTVDLYLCPSEQLDTRHEFVERYANSVDAVLFSPPYYDLEIYPGEEQSLSSFPNYQDWLEGYWNETVKIAVEVLRPGGRFAFVISDYRNKDKQEVAISQDMMHVVRRHMPLKQHYKVQWSAITGSRQAKKTRGGNFEDLWLFEKP
jgi:hypothetical protein